MGLGARPAPAWRRDPSRRGPRDRRVSLWGGRRTDESARSGPAHHRAAQWTDKPLNWSGTRPGAPSDSLSELGGGAWSGGWGGEGGRDPFLTGKRSLVAQVRDAGERLVRSRLAPGAWRQACGAWRRDRVLVSSPCEHRRGRGLPLRAPGAPTRVPACAPHSGVRHMCAGSRKTCK